MNDDQNIGETQRLSSENAPRSRGTNGRKIVLTFLGACGLMLAICCGIAFYGQSTTNDPTEITTFQKEIVEIDLPANLYPGMGISRPLSLTKMKMAFYNPKQATSLMLIGFLDDAEHDYERSMKSCRDHANEFWDTGFQVESTERKSVQIFGGSYEFEFVKGTIILPGGRTTPGRLVFGRFPAKNYTTGFIRYSIEESAYEEDAVIQMLESIRKSQ